MKTVRNSKFPQLGVTLKYTHTNSVLGSDFDAVQSEATEKTASTHKLHEHKNNQTQHDGDDIIEDD